jgi:hypothetical protein
VTRQIWALDPATYVRHPLHQIDRVWPESNCAVDLWLELLHTADVEPLAALPFTIAIDLEGDQWTFFKFPVADLYALYGVDVFELSVWRPLTDHIEDQLARGRPLVVEVDAFHLPDTRGTSYHAEHIKTSIGVQAIDAGARRLGYFHNAGYYELEDADFGGVFRLEGHVTDPEYLPPYVEVTKLGAGKSHVGRALVERSVELLGVHLAKRPTENPFRRYAIRFPADLEWLAGEPIAQFHRYAFATLRQCGAAFELAATYLRWLQANGEYDLERMACSCDVIATTAKTLQFKTARVVGTHRPFDAAPMLETMAAAWEETMAGLTERYGCLAHQA